MKILLLTQYFPPEFGAAAARNSEHARFWAEMGHEVEVCTGFPNYPSGVVPDEYRGRLYAREKRDGYGVVRSWIYATPNRSVLKRALASLSFMNSALISGLFLCRRPDVVIASSGPFFVGPLGYLLSVFKRAPLVFEVRDILPQQAVDVGMIRNPLLIWTLQTFEEFLYRRARCVVTVAQASKDSIVSRGFQEEKFAVIENGIREDLFAPGSKTNAVREEFGWNDKFIALYVGAHGVSQGLFTLLEAAEKLRDRDDIRFVFIGDGADKPKMVGWAEQHELTNVEFLPLQPKERMPVLYAAADACFVPLRKGEYFTINIPSKIFEIMACARPIILGATGQALRIVESAGGGIAVPPEDAAAYTEAVLKLRDDSSLGERLGASGRAYVLEHFTRRQKARQYSDVLESAIGATGKRR
ncbi:MAG: glycosyltransferase family 4 protein [Candidatus Hydrogenedentes bacterium]|nr:glycosyltransferase family 4 protein [Candidatus Hydrogenedentota bacterium]